jgi:autotransporter passenger strand-loop-strand repeat protein
MSDTFVSSGTHSGGTVTSGNAWYVFASGLADFTTVASGGQVFVYGGGRVRGTDLQSAGVLQVSQDGTASAVTAAAGSFLTVSSGGAAYASEVAGDLYVSGGTIYGTTLSGADAFAYVSGGAAYDTNIYAGGFLDVGGLASGVTLGAGGGELVAYGAVQSGAALFAGGDAQILGQDLGALVEAGGFLEIGSLGLDQSGHVLSGGLLDIASGGAAYDTVSRGGVEAVMSGGTAGGTVQSGGLLIVAGGADVAGVTVVNGGAVVSTGVALVSGAAAQVLGSVSGVNLTAVGDAAFVLSGGVATDMGLQDGAVAQICAGGTAISAAVASGGVIDIFAGGITSATILSGGAEYLSGGTAFFTTVSGGIEYVYGGTASGTTVDGPSASQDLYGGIAVDTTVISGGTQGVYGFYSTVITENTVLKDGGNEIVDEGDVASNTTIDGGTLTLDYGLASGSVLFSGGGGEFIIDQPSLPDVVISGFGMGDTIELESVVVSAGAAFTVDTPGLLVISAGGTTYDLTIAGADALTPFILTSGSGGYLDLTENAACFAAGTRILTPRGEVAVETLRVGDEVITQSGDDAKVKWIGRRRIDLTRHRRPREAQPIRISANAFADGVPVRDLLLSPDHALFFEDALIPVKALVNGRNVVQLSRPAVSYFHIELPQHDVIFAERCAVESYLETGNRGAFENAGVAITLHPDFAQTLREANCCHPFTETGPKVDLAARRLMERHYAVTQPSGAFPAGPNRAIAEPVRQISSRRRMSRAGR